MARNQHLQGIVTHERQVRARGPSRRQRLRPSERVGPTAKGGPRAAVNSLNHLPMTDSSTCFARALGRGGSTDMQQISASSLAVPINGTQCSAALTIYALTKTGSSFVRAHLRTCNVPFTRFILCLSPTPQSHVRSHT